MKKLSSLQDEANPPSLSAPSLLHSEPQHLPITMDKMGGGVCPGVHISTDYQLHLEIFCCSFYLFQGFFCAVCIQKKKNKNRPKACFASEFQSIVCRGSRLSGSHRLGGGRKKRQKKKTGSERSQRFECGKCAPMPIKARQAEGLIETHGESDLRRRTFIF